MEPKHAIVINGYGYKEEFVRVDFTDQDGKIIGIPYEYTMKDGESLIYEDIEMALSMIKSRWTGAEWEEAATAEEIEVARPELLPSKPTLEEQVKALSAAFIEMAGEIYG